MDTKQQLESVQQRLRVIRELERSIQTAIEQYSTVEQQLLEELQQVETSN